VTPAAARQRIATLAELIGPARHVAVGALSPIPAAAALLARARHGTRVTLLGSERHNPFTDGGRELFDAAAQGRIDVFFLGGVQIDGAANVNLLGLGPYPGLTKRFAGAFGSAFLYFVVPKIILYREAHSPRTLVERVDVVSAPGTSPAGVWRPGGPSHLLTGRALFAFDRAAARFRLTAHDPDETIACLRARTGFAFDVADEVAAWSPPDAETERRLDEVVAPALAETYPAFARRTFPPSPSG
jgi:glutaconate CoA-transferase subunit B